jgi:hypothetical protein
MAEVHVDDVGTSLRCTIYDEDGEIVDLSDATELVIKLKSPSGVTSSKSASLYTDGTDGIIEYITEDGDIDEEGKWQLQGYVEVGGGHFSSSIHDFFVECNLS